jgi:hypothetical protein
MTAKTGVDGAPAAAEEGQRHHRGGIISVSKLIGGSISQACNAAASASCLPAAGRVAWRRRYRHWRRRLGWWQYRRSANGAARGGGATRRQPSCGIDIAARRVALRRRR